MFKLLFLNITDFNISQHSGERYRTSGPLVYSECDEMYPIKRYDVDIINQGNISKELCMFLSTEDKSRCLLDDLRICLKTLFFL